MNKTGLYIIAIFAVYIGLAVADSMLVDSEPAGEETISGEPNLVLIVDISGDITSLTADRVIDAVDQAEEEYADLLIILMDTPGGHMLSEWDITKAIMNSRVPVAVYVWPVGARAGSAGVYICYSAHVAAMAPNTNIGAAHPVAIGGQMDSVMSDKVTNDAVASIKAMAERYGRNAEWAEESIRQSVSITSREALELGVIDLIAEDIDDLIKQVNGREVKTAAGTKAIRVDRPIKENIKKTFWQSILDILVNPNVVFALLAIGGLGITMEIYNPGSIFPGVIGGICIILAAYGIRILPINFAGLLLIILAILLFIMEIKIVSHGMLTIGGIISLVLGGVFLIDTADPQLKVSLTVIITTAIVIGLFVVFAFYFVYKARVSRPTTGREGLVGKTAEVRTKIDRTGYVYLNGELWEASAEEVIEAGEQVEVIEIDSLKLKVKRKS